MRLLTKYKNQISTLAGKYLLPMLLCYSVMKIIIGTYFVFYSGIFTAVSVVYMGALIFLFEKIKPRKILRGIVYLLVGAAVILVCRWLLSAGWNSSGVWFVNWFYVTNQEAGQVSEYSATILIFFSFFLASIVYYFSIIRFRASGLMLAVLLPFIIYGKKALIINDFDMVVMVTVYLALVIHGKLSADDMKHDTLFNYSYIIAGLVFVTFVGMVTMFIPKPEIKSYLENNRNFFDFRVNSELSAFSNLNSESSPRFGANATGELLFKVRDTNNSDVLYLRRQAFDDFINDRWINNENINRSMESFGQYNTTPIGSNKNYYSFMRDGIAKTVLEDSNITRSFDYFRTENPFDTDNLKLITLSYEDSFAPSYICAELNVDTTVRTSSQRIYRTTHSETYPYTYTDTAAKSAQYYYYPYDTNRQNYAKSLSYDTAAFGDILDKAFEQNNITSKQYDAVRSVIKDYTDPDHYSISDRLAQLAKQITANCKNDYEKAEAFVKYFEQNGFKYDLDYEPPDESIDYFVFTSKTGSCTSYATAMALMARSVGLPTRYVEGFAAYERDENDHDLFVVRDLNAHAFVECFIAGAGWMTFDPTVPGYMTISANNNTSNVIGNIASYLGRAALFLAAGFVLIFIVFLDRIDETIFRLRLRRKPMSVKPIMLYQRIIKLLNRQHANRKFDGYTPLHLKDHCMNKLGADISQTVEMFQRCCFGGIEPSREEFAAAFSQYKQNWKLIAKGKKPEKVPKVPKVAEKQA